MPYQHYCSECRRFFASKQRLVSHNLKKHPPVIEEVKADPEREMKKGDIFGNDSDNESEENESDNESEKSEKSEENDGDDEDKESKNGSDDEDDKESNNESDKESNNDDDDAKDNKWEEYDSIEPHNDESIWTKIREQAVQDLEDKFEEVDKNIQAQGFSGKEAKFRAYRETLKPLRKRVYKI